MRHVSKKVAPLPYGGVNCKAAAFLDFAAAVFVVGSKLYSWVICALRWVYLCQTTKVDERTPMCELLVNIPLRAYRGPLFLDQPAGRPRTTARCFGSKWSMKTSQSFPPTPSTVPSSDVSAPRQAELLRIDLQLLEAHRREVGLADLDEDGADAEPETAPVETVETAPETPEPETEPETEEEMVELEEELEPGESLRAKQNLKVR